MNLTPRSFLYFVALILNFIAIANASVDGRGDGSIGVSYDDGEYIGGARGAYSLAGTYSRQRYDISLSGERTTDSNRMSPAEGHAYQFQKFFYQMTADHTMEFSNPYLSWVSAAQYRKSSLDGQSAFPENWLIVSGPKYNRRLRDDLDVVASVNVGRSFSSQSYINDIVSTLEFDKHLTARTTSGLRTERVCASSDTSEGKDCSTEVALNLVGDYQNFDYLAQRGSAFYKGDTIPTYQLNLSFKANYFNTLALNYSKERLNTRSIIEQNLNGNVATNSVYVINQSGLYRYINGQLSLTAEYSKLDQVITDQAIDGREIAEVEQRAYVLLQYGLSSSQCTDCLLKFDYRRSNNTSRIDWSSVGFGLEIPIRSQWTQEVSVRRTENENRDPYLSVNYVINYNGLLSR